MLGKRPNKIDFDAKSMEMAIDINNQQGRK